MKATPPLTKTVLLQHIEPKCEFVNKQSMARGISLDNECIQIALITTLHVLRILNEGLYHLFCCRNQQSDMEISYDNQILISNSESPVVVVLSGSMEPAFRRGDILFLWMQSEHFAVGDIVVFKIDQREIPIVHRVHRVYVVCE
jgi:hypothetical protein